VPKTPRSGGVSSKVYSAYDVDPSNIIMRLGMVLVSSQKCSPVEALSLYNAESPSKVLKYGVKTGALPG
jgi:hypothetical protein